MLQQTKSFSPHVILRILEVLSYHGPMKRTTLAGKTRLNYLVLMKYLEFLKSLYWVDSPATSSNVSITSMGSTFRELIARYVKNGSQSQSTERVFVPAADRDEEGRFFLEQRI